MLATAAVKAPWTVLHYLASNPSPSPRRGPWRCLKTFLAVTTVGGATGIQEVEVRVLHSAQDSPPKKGGPGSKHWQCRGRGTRRQACLQVPWPCDGNSSPKFTNGEAEAAQRCGVTRPGSHRFWGRPSGLSLKPAGLPGCCAASSLRAGVRQLVYLCPCSALRADAPLRSPGSGWSAAPVRHCDRSAPFQRLVSPVIYPANTSWVASGSGGA